MTEFRRLELRNYGEGAVRFGHELRNAENTTGTGAKNPDDYK